MRFVRQLSEQQRGQLLEALQNWDDASEVRRVRAIRLSSKGWTVEHISEALDVCRRSVRNWINWYERDGLEGLKTSYSPGRPAKADEHYREVLERSVETAPREMGYPFSRWTLSRLATHMKKQTGVSLNPCYLSEVLKDLGFTYKRPRHDLSHKRDRQLYEQKKSELQDLKKGLWTRAATTNCSL